ncbi:hypothetical protein LUZ63_007578 [Rhynchospora breviuscula]|uniref:Wound-induced protein 1 n=1 Tax=Rhynchospora breviuscula TaxID=2022672 RepID=A0A9Q0CRX8_9POAL|nr:hypothetical protein LUZ63_007578 [Rhynchospora breviuscula]
MDIGERNKMLVESLYESLSKGDMEAAAGILAEDVDWWFHGPRRCQHMRRLLTGEAATGEFQFVPRQVAQVGGGRWVVAEGWEGQHAYWVHAWEVENGVITRFREYFNTSVTVREVGPGSSEMTFMGPSKKAGMQLWQSKAHGPLGRSMPGLVLAV